MKRKRNDPFKGMKQASMGFAGLSIGTAVGAGIAAQAPAGTPSLMGGYSAMAGFAPMIGTMAGAGTVLKMTKKFKKY